MYIGRFVIVGRTSGGDWYLGYRVSSRSFPNRFIKLYEARAAVLPTPDAAASDNPYISYNCFKSAAQLAVIGNGSQVDPVYDKLTAGYPLRDALALSLLALDYEHDAYNTPRIAATLDAARGVAFLGFIGHDKVYSRQVDPAPGQAWLIATYECTEPTEIKLAGETAQQLADAIYTSEYDHPVTCMAAVWQGGAYQLATRAAR
jgi:IMP cyclohydrolase